MVGGHPLSTGFIQVTLTSQSTVSVSLFVMVGGNGLSAKGLKRKKLIVAGGKSFQNAQLSGPYLSVSINLKNGFNFHLLFFQTIE